MPVLTNALDAALRSEGYRVRIVVPGKTARQAGPNRFEVDFNSAESLSALRNLLAATEVNPTNLVGGIASFLAMIPELIETRADFDGCTLPIGLFHAFKEFIGDLQDSAKNGSSVCLNFTAMDGAFGLVEPKRAAATPAAVAGLLKTLSREVGAACVRNVDLDPAAPAEMQFSQIVEEFSQPRGELEVGLRNGKRVSLRVKPSPIDKHAAKKLDLDSESVIVITGGARGVTALIARALARETHGRILLVGRTPLPPDEGTELAQLTSQADLRTHFIRQSRQDGKRANPATIEQSVRAVLRDREIRENIEAVKDFASETHYRAVDVRNDEEFSQVLAEVYDRWGRIDGVIHGAGLIEDKLIRDKTADSFLRVFETKVRSADTLVRCLKPEQLKYLVFFTSVSGRFGNTGQCDYSAANEYLSKLARKLDAEWPGRVVAISWGPWDAGMMSDELRRLYISRGIHPMPAEAGVEAFMNELRLQGCRDSEIVLGTSIREIADFADQTK